jgi:Protein of unknown function (DUF4232)
MKLSSRTARRIGAATATTCAAILIPAVALAAPGHSASAARAPGCSTADLTTWVGIPADGSAGTFTFQLELSNVSGHACTLFGFPGVSATGALGRQLGSAARRNHSHPARLVTLGRGATAHVELGVADVSNFPKSVCHPVTASGLRVFPPNDRRSESIPFTFRACQKRGPQYLSVTTTIAGTGIPSFSS